MAEVGGKAYDAASDTRRAKVLEDKDQHDVVPPKDEIRRIIKTYGEPVHKIWISKTPDGQKKYDTFNRTPRGRRGREVIVAAAGRTDAGAVDLRPTALCSEGAERLLQSPCPSLRGAKRRRNPEPSRGAGSLRLARDDRLVVRGPPPAAGR